MGTCLHMAYIHGAPVKRSSTLVALVARFLMHDRVLLQVTQLFKELATHFAKKVTTGWVAGRGVCDQCRDFDTCYTAQHAAYIACVRLVLHLVT